MDESLVIIPDDKIVGELNSEISKKQDEISELEDELAAKEEEITGLKLQLRDEKEEVTSLRERLAECEPRMRDLMNQNKGLERRNRILEEEGQKDQEEANAKIQDLEERLEGFPPPDEVAPKTESTAHIDKNKAVAQGASLLQLETLKEELEFQRAEFAKQTAEREAMMETERAMMEEEVAALRNENRALKQNRGEPPSPEAQGKYKDMIEVMCKAKAGQTLKKQFKMYLKGESLIGDIYSLLFERLEADMKGNEIIELAAKQPDGRVRLEGAEAGRCLNSFVHDHSTVSKGRINCEYKITRG